MDLEACVIASVLDNDGMKEALEARITVDFFAEEEHQNIWEWMAAYFREHAATPTLDAFSHRFPKYQLEAERKEPLTFLIDQLREQRKENLLRETISGVREFYDEGDTENAIKWLSSSLQDILTETTKVHDIDLTEGADMWLDEYKEQVRQGRWFSGIPTGFDFIDRVLGGVQNGQLITLVGLPKAGKSLALLWSATCAHTAGHKTSFTTFEMSTEEQRLRHHAFRAGVSYNRLRFGKLRIKETNKIRKMLNGLSGMQPMMFTHDPSSVMTVSALAAKIAEHQPEIAFVDGVYLMESELTGVEKGSAQALTSITRDLKRLAQRQDIPIICTTQALFSKYSVRRGMRMDSIGYTSSFAQDSDAIFGVENDPEDPKNYMLLSVVAARNAPPARARYKFSWDPAYIHEVEELDEEFEGEEDRVDE